MSKIDSFTTSALLTAIKQTGDQTACADLYRQMTSQNEGGPSEAATEYYKQHTGKLVFIVGTMMLGYISGLNTSTTGFYPGSRYPIYVNIVGDYTGRGENVTGQKFEYSPSDLQVWPDDFHKETPAVLTHSRVEDPIDLLIDFETMLTQASNQQEYDYYESEYCKAIYDSRLGLVYASALPSIITSAQLTFGNVMEGYSSSYAEYLSKNIRPHYGLSRMYFIVIKLIMLGMQYNEAIVRAEHFSKTGEW